MRRTSSGRVQPREAFCCADALEWSLSVPKQPSAAECANHSSIVLIGVGTAVGPDSLSQPATHWRPRFERARMELAAAMNLLGMLICRGINIAWSVVRTFRFMFYVCSDFWLAFCIALPITAGGTTIAEFLARGLTREWRIAIMVLPWVFLIALMQRMSRFRRAIEGFYEARGWPNRVMSPLGPMAMILHGVMAFCILFTTFLLVVMGLLRVHPDGAFVRQVRADAPSMSILFGLIMAGFAVALAIGRLQGRAKSELDRPASQE